MKRSGVCLPLPKTARLMLFIQLIALLEPLYSSGCIDHFPFAGEERVTLTAQLNVQLLFSRADSISIAAGADNLCVGIIFGMYLFFHSYLSA